MDHIIRNTIQNIKLGKIYSYRYVLKFENSNDNYLNNGEIVLLEHVSQLTVNLGKTINYCKAYTKLTLKVI